MIDFIIGLVVGVAFGLSVALSIFVQGSVPLSDAVAHGCASWVTVPAANGAQPTVEFRWHDEVAR